MLKLTSTFSTLKSSIFFPKQPLNIPPFNSLHFLPNPFNFPFFPLRLRRVSSMSSSRPPSAFDKLMSGARAAASKKKSPSSPIKRKNPNPNPNNPTDELVPVSTDITANESHSPSKKSKLGVKEESIVTTGSNLGESPSKKSKLGVKEESIVTTGSNLGESPSKKSKLGVKEESIVTTGSNLGESPSKKSKLGVKEEPVVTAGSNVSESSIKSSNVSAMELKKSKLGVNVDEFVVNLQKKPPSFEPKLAGWWEDGEKVPFLFVAKAFDLIKAESKRIVITDITCNLLRTVIAKTPEDLLSAVYLLANKIAPAHQGIELGIGDASLVKALAEACGATEAKIRTSYQDLGDLGDVAKEMRSKQSMMRQPLPLTIAKVFNTFQLIAQASGKDSQEKKKNYIKSLLVAARDCEPVYLIRLLQSKLRISLAEQTLLVALGHAAVYSEEHSKPSSHIQTSLEEPWLWVSAAEGDAQTDTHYAEFTFKEKLKAGKIVKQVYSVLPVYDKVIPALINGGVWNLSQTCTFTPGVPIGPMLAKPTKGVSEIIDKFQNREFTCEYKYDGERAQIHYMEDGTVEIYSRNAERNTGKYPDVIASVNRLKKSPVSSFVLDCEIVAFDREKQKILPFQILSTRARKNVKVSEIKVDVSIFAFDILYLNGKSLLQEQLTVRRKHLYDSFEEEPGFFQFATTVTSNDLEEIQKFLEDAVNGSCEGLIIKTMDMDATYEPSKRSNNWVKLKKDYMDSVGDSLDLVPIGAFHGRGKRTGVYGAFLLACYDRDNEEFQSICKIGTGFSEVVLEERSTSLRSKVIPTPKSYFRFGDNLKPDVWFEPSEVWEVKAADLTISPVHRAAVGIVDSSKGISLRFPRLVRVREDKTPEDATSADQVAEMYNAQAHTQGNKNQDEEDE